MNYESNMAKAKLHLSNAVAADKAGNYSEALGLYRSSADHWNLLYKYEQSDMMKGTFRTQLMSCITRAEELRDALNPPNTPPQTGGAGPSGVSQAKRKDDDASDEKEKDKLSSALDGAIVTEKPNVSWDDVAGLEKAKDSLQEAVILPVKFPQLFEGKRRPWKGLLMYGPPGTGKSYLAKACATEADAVFFSISSSDLVSKWMGESEKLVRTLFEKARDSSPAIIFIDEVDSMCGSRESGENDASRRIKTEFLVQMQGVGKAETQLLVLGATNTPWDLDAAIRRRFERRIYIPLPEQNARFVMFQLNIGDTPHQLTEDNLHRLAEQTEGFSGADVAILVQAALMEPVRICRTATHFKPLTDETGRPRLEPCSPGDADAQAMTMMTMPDPSLLLAPRLNYDHIVAALQDVRPSVGREDLARYEGWTAEFGMEG